MARYDWTAEKDPPVTVSERMIHEGIGVMNTRLLMLIDSMIDLLEITDRLSDEDKEEFIGAFESGTFGKQTRMIKSLFKDTEIRYSQFEDAVDKRNKIIHEYRSYESDNLRKDAIEIHNLVRQLMNMTSTVDHLYTKARSQQKKSTNKKKSKTKQAMDRIFKEKNDEGTIHKSLFCKLLLEEGIEPGPEDMNWDTLFRNNGYYVQGKGPGQRIGKLN
ncbi:MAG: hypothetical protein RBR71_12950 [Gudongella sp.]|jgi:hypothetical protein|nr:hypothetical protein [Gudongella sp.]